MQLASVFTDHAVLQRDMPIPVWGRARPRDWIRIVLGDAVVRTVAGADGRFLVRLPPRPAGGPYILSAEAWPAKGSPTEPGAETATIRDVWVGEVWLASGQSNMAQTIAETGFDAAATALSRRVRMFTVPRAADLGRAWDIDAAWAPARAETVSDFSAVAFHFAARLERELGVAIGILHSSWGGTVIEAWTSRETLRRNPDMRADLLRYDADLASPDFWARMEEAGDAPTFAAALRRAMYAKYAQPDPGNAGAGRGWADPGHDDSDWETIKLPALWTQFLRDKSGAFWFRRQVDIPAAAAGKDLLLDLGAVDKHDITYWNGEQVGATGSGFDDSTFNQLRRYTVPGRLVRAGRNVVAARAFSFVYGGGLTGPEMFARPAVGGPVDLSGVWRVKSEFEIDKPAVLNMPGGLPSPGNPTSPHRLFDQMIHPLIPYAIRGVIWYQGESNAARWPGYRRQMIDLASDWRFHWGQDEFPVIQVQLANYGSAADYDGNSDWARLREAQFLAARDGSGIGMASAIDIGEANDIHPRNKRDVGARLAGWALARIYRRPDVAAHGPHFERYEIEGDRIRIHFTGADGGLKMREGAGEELRTFHVAGIDRVFKPAKARIEGDTVVVWNPGEDSPAAARYAWSQNPEAANLVNGAGLPASSFRTDCWP